MSTKHLARLFGAALLTACGLNASVKTPTAGELTRTPGAWVAYNLGCKLGCKQIRRGDLITAVDGRPISSGAEIDAVDLARGTPVQLDLYRPRTGEALQVQLVAEPYEYMAPIAHVPPLWTVGTAALDRAPDWARLNAFGHATPAMRLYKMDSPREYVDGRDLFGRGALIVLWSANRYTRSTERISHLMLLRWYAELQARYAELTANGVDTYLVFAGKYAEPTRRDLRTQAIGDGTYRAGTLPIYANKSNPNNPNTRGLEHAAADMNEMIFNDGRRGPAILILDARGIVRWHSRGFENESEPDVTLKAAIDFSLHALVDEPLPPLTPLTTSY